MHTYQVHSPYKPPEDYQQLFTTGDGAPLGPGSAPTSRRSATSTTSCGASSTALRKVVPESDLLLIVTADHGEEFGEHGVLLTPQLYDEVMHVPLLVVWAGRIRAGLRVAPPVSLVDVAPTILDLVRLAGSRTRWRESASPPC